LVLKLGVTLFQARKGIVPTKKLFSTLKKLFSLRKKSFSEKIYTPIPHHYLIFTVALATALCLVRASIIDKQRERESSGHRNSHSAQALHTRKIARNEPTMGDCTDPSSSSPI
jgi:hypothetical protein